MGAPRVPSAPPAQEAVRSSGRTGSARPPPIPLNLTQALTSDPAPCPSPALRVILVEVGEQQLAGTGLSALARQVHGCARATDADPPLAGARAARLGRPAGARYTQDLRPVRLVAPLAASRCTGTNCRLIPSPLLFMLQSRDGLCACAVPPTLATHGGVRRRPAA